MAGGEAHTPAVAVPHVSGAQRFFARALYVFFAKPVRFLLPAIAVTLFGVATVANKPAEYRSVGSLAVTSETFLASLSEAGTGSFGFDPPARKTSLQFNELIQTGEFATAVLVNAGMEQAASQGLIDIRTVRRNVYALDAGNELMYVIAVSDNPSNAQALARSAIETFKNWIASSEVSGTEIAGQFWDDQIAEYRDEVAAAEADVAAFLERVGPRAPDALTATESLESQRLNEALTRSEQRLDAAVDKRESARLATVVAAEDIQQRIRVLDEPVAPVAPQSGLRDAATTVIVFTFLGSLLSLVAIVLATLTERSVLSAADLERVGVPVRAVVPRSKRVKLAGDRLHPVPTAAHAPVRVAS